MKKKVIIIGGGPGGYVAALTAAQKESDVTLIEEGAVGGTCLNRGCIPTKALLASSELLAKIRQAQKYGITVGEAVPSLPAMMERKNGVVKTLRTAVEGLLKKRGVRVIAAHGRLVSERRVEAGGEILEGDAVILAAGTEVLRLWEGDGIITSDEALDLKSIPDTILVVGAGAVGVEMACFFSEIGTRATLVEMLPQVLPGMDGEIAETLARELKKKGITVKTGCRIDTIEGKTVKFDDGKSAEFDLVLQAVGRSFNTRDLGLESVGITTERGRISTDGTMRTAIPGVYAIGDIVAGSPMLAHAASAQGITAALHIAGQAAAMDYSAIPCCVYSHPEVASVGLREDEIENGISIKIPYRAIGRAHASGEIAGLLKIVAEKNGGPVRGVHMVGEKATDLIHEGVLSVKLGLKIGQLAEVIRAHPTFSEIFSEAYHALEGRAVHTL